MAELAMRRMSLEEFLRWDDGTDTRYELIGGFAVAMAPPADVHSTLAARLIVRIGSALASRRPCRVVSEAGVIRPDRADSFYVADIAATFAPVDLRRQSVEDPFLIVEILSPSTERHDRRIKVPNYQQIGSVEEIVLVASDGVYAELHRRSGPQWIIQILRGRDAVLSLASVPLDIPLSEVYEDIPLADLETETAAGR